MKILRIIVSVFLVSAFTYGCYKKNGTGKNSISIKGKWKSKSPEKAGDGVFAVRGFRLLDNLWQFDYTLYLDSDLQKPVFLFQGEGSYEIEDHSPKIEGAFNVTSKICKKYITLLTDDKETIKNFGFDVYNLEKGRKMDISETGCSFITPVNECEIEYDIIKISGDELCFGKRPADNNISKPEKRPGELGIPLVKY